MMKKRSSCLVSGLIPYSIFKMTVDSDSFVYFLFYAAFTIENYLLSFCILSDPIRTPDYHCNFCSSPISRFPGRSPTALCPSDFLILCICSVYSAAFCLARTANALICAHFARFRFAEIVGKKKQFRWRRRRLRCRESAMVLLVWRADT